MARPPHDNWWKTHVPSPGHEPLPLWATALTIVVCSSIIGFCIGMIFNL